MNQTKKHIVNPQVALPQFHRYKTAAADYWQKYNGFVSFFSKGDLVDLFPTLGIKTLNNFSAELVIDGIKGLILYKTTIENNEIAGEIYLYSVHPVNNELKLIEHTKYGSMGKSYDLEVPGDGPLHLGYSGHDFYLAAHFLWRLFEHSHS